MVSFTDVPPLQSDTPIVDPRSGRPSSQFIRLWQNTFQNAKGNATTAQEAIDLVNAMSAKEIVAGTALDGGGTLGAPGPLTIDHADSTVTPGTYGSATKIPVVEVDAQGHVTEVTEEDVQSLPAGGTTGQVLAKASDTDYDVEWVDQSGGGGGGGSYTLIEDFVAVGGETEKIFSPPSTFKDLIIVASIKTNHSDIQQVQVQVNSDTGNNYNYFTIDHYRSGSDYKESNTGTNAYRMGYAANAATGGNGTATAFGYSEAVILDYTSTVKKKRLGGWYNGGRLNYDTVNGQATGEWNNDAAITALRVFIDTSTMQAGSRITLYGRGAAGGGGGGGGTPPTLVQMATLRNDGTLTLPSTPTVGNLLVFVSGGWAGSLGGYVPGGFTWMGYYPSNSNNAVAMATRWVESGDTGSYSLSASDNQFCAIYEYSGASGVQPVYGWYAGPVGSNCSVAVGTPYGRIRHVALENDRSDFITVTAATGLTVDINPMDGSNHTGWIARVDSTFTGAIKCSISGTWDSTVFGIWDVLGT